MSSSSSAEVAATIFGYIIEHRLFLCLLNLVVGALFLLFLRSIPWLRRRNVDFWWFKLLVRETDSDYDVPFSGLARHYWKAYLPLPSCRMHLRLSAIYLSYSSTPSSPDPELGRSLNRSRNITPFVVTEPHRSNSIRSNPEDSKRGSSGAYASIFMPRRLEPLRPGGSFTPDIQASSDDLYASTMNNSADHPHKESFSPPIPSPSISTHVDPESPGIDISDMREAGSPVVLIPEEDGPSSPGRNSEDQEPQASSPARYRPPTYGTMFSQQSIMTLPLYREHEDESRISVASHAPTYRSRRSMIPPRPRRGSRSSRPHLPPPNAPLPPPPSSFMMAKY